MFDWPSPIFPSWLTPTLVPNEASASAIDACTPPCTRPDRLEHVWPYSHVAGDDLLGRLVDLEPVMVVERGRPGSHGRKCEASGRMNVGVGLPTTTPGTTGALLLDWARRADEGPFSSLGVLDRVVYDSLEPFTALAAAAGVTRARGWRR